MASKPCANQMGTAQTMIDRRAVVRNLITTAAIFTSPKLVFADEKLVPANDPGGPRPPNSSPPSQARMHWPEETVDQTALFEAYGDPRDSSMLRRVRTPWPLQLAWAPDQHRDFVLVHHKCADSVGTILERVLQAYGPAEIQRLRLNVYGGDHNDRRMAGASRWSLHAWGIALDFDPTRNQLRWGADKAQLARPDYAEWWGIWEAEGWYSLGRNKNYDWMHVQAAWRK